MERIAVIGLGNIAVRHRRNLKSLFPNSTIYVMSSSGRELEGDIENADVVVFNVDELVCCGIQLAIVASPASYHCRDAVTLIESGIPTLIEKPIASNRPDAERIKLAEESFKTPVAVGYCLRYLPSAKKMKSLIEGRVLGDLYNVSVEIGQFLPDWRPNKDYRSSVSANADLGGGALLELSHEIDYVQWMLGSISVEHAILRSSKELDLDVEDCADILATIDNNTVLNIHLDFLQRKAFRQCRFVGSKGVIIWDLIQNSIQMSTKEGAYFLYQEPQWDKNQMYLEMLIDFIRKIRGSDNQAVNVSESLETIALIEKIKTNYPVN